MLVFYEPCGLIRAMKLSDYLKRFSQEQRANFALRVGTTLGHLNNVAYGQRTASAALTRSIADATGREVPEWELREDWILIWPELGAAVDALGGTKSIETKAA